LEGVEADYTPAAWGLMEAQLDLEDNLAELEDADVVDAVAYSHLNNLEVPYNDNTWQPLSDKLDEEDSFRKRILYRYKIIEIGVMLLFIFTLFHYLPAHKQVVEKIKDKVAKAKTEAPAQLYADNPAISKAATENATSQSTTTTAKTNTANTAAKKNTNSAKVVTKTTTQPSINNATKATVTTATTTSPTVANTTNTNIIDAVTVDPTNTVSPAPTTIESLANTATINNNNTQQESAITTFNQQTTTVVAPISEKKEELTTVENASTTTLDDERIADISAIPTLKARFLEEPAQDVIDCIQCRPLPLPLAIKAAMFMVGDYNYIMTPYDRDFDLKSYNHAARGYGMGFTIAFGLGNWEVETGAIYAAKNYKPKSIPEVLGDFQNGYIENRLKDIELAIIQVPLNVRYNFDKLPDWNFYAMAGTSLNVAVQATYYWDAEYSSRPQPGSSQSPQEIINEESTYNNKKRFSNGWFEGGTFLENRYYTANLGLGMERQLTSKWSVFAQSSYHHTLTGTGLGLGPNKDRLNTISVSVGARATLK